MEETSANSERSWLFKRANDKPKDVFNQSAWLIGLNEDYEIRPKGLDGGGTEKLTCWIDSLSIESKLSQQKIERESRLDQNWRYSVYIKGLEVRGSR